MFVPTSHFQRAYIDYRSKNYRVQMTDFKGKNYFGFHTIINRIYPKFM